jgi:hypothetical protein
MTEETNRPKSAADTDALVTRTYRETAGESAPEHLNRAILEEAAHASRPLYSRLISWTRPMAWAATVVLSVALVLEVTNAPTPEGVIFDDNTGKLGPRERDHEAGLSNDAPAGLIGESVLPATTPERISNGAVPSAPQVEPMKSTAKQAVPEAALEKRQRSDAWRNRVEKQELAMPASSAEEFEFRDTEMLQRADDMARIHSGENKESALVSSAADTESADAVVQGANAVILETLACNESETATPETWMKCIVALEEAGLADAAREQRALLHKVFPQFDPR